MATTIPQLLNYEEYLAEEEINRRYDILDGERIFMPNPTRHHQIILFNVATALNNYKRQVDFGQMIVAPCDVLITRVPLRTRQPDALLISHAQLAYCTPDTDPNALEAAPELVVEILSPSETRGLRAGKINDYCAIGVRECWVISPDPQTVEVLALTPTGANPVALYDITQTVQSAILPDLTVPVADIFAP
jgi:Uma2 family endonuclease